jgi:hypothetical protein
MGPRQHRDRHDWHSGRCPLAPAGVILGPSGWPLGTAASGGAGDQGADGEGGVEDAAVMQERQTPVLRRCRGRLAAGGPVWPESVRALPGPSCRCVRAAQAGPMQRA